MIVYGAGGLIGENENMIDTFEHCTMYGNDCGFMYSHQAKIIGVVCNDGTELLCKNCGFRYSCQETEAL